MNTTQLDILPEGSTLYLESITGHVGTCQRHGDHWLYVGGTNFLGAGLPRPPEGVTPTYSSERLALIVSDLLLDWRQIDA
jgi:hypothetical protein